MKRFFKYLVVVVVGVLMILLALDYMVTKGLQKSKDWRFQMWTDIMHDDINADVVILGNSRAAMHYDVNVLDSILGYNCYNLGRQGLTGDLTVYPFLIYKEKTEHLPKYVIYNIDYLTFPAGKQPWMTNLPQIAPYIADTDIRERILQNKDWFDNTRLSLYLPFYRYFGYTDDILEGLTSCIFSKSIPYDEQVNKGYHPLVNNPNKPNFDDIVNIRGFDISKRNAKLIEDEIIVWCKEQGIEVILVHSPIYRYDIQYAEAKHIAEYDSVINHYIQTYDLRYLDYSRDSMSNNPDNFADLVHLKQPAAKRFSVRLANDLDSLGVLHVDVNDMKCVGK